LGVDEILKIKHYPEVNVSHNSNPSRLYAIPFVGIVVKLILLIPVFLLILGLGIAAWILSIINSFYVLFADRYWETAYDVTMMLMRYSTKMMFYLNGLTDQYPGFGYKERDTSLVNIPMPTKPNKLFAIPILGILARVILTIPYSIWSSVLANAYKLGLLVYAWWSVLLNGVYPEAIYELVKDSQRVSLAQTAYMAGLSDNYPSFNISWNHKNLKIALIVVAAILSIFQFMSNLNKQNDYKYQNYGEYSYSNYQ
jgi:hypothetical protein